MSLLASSLTGMSSIAASPAQPWSTTIRRWASRLHATWLLHTAAVLVDVETTGFEGRICEIAVLDTTGRVLLDTLVDPQIPVPAEATAVHGITDQDLVDAPTWEHLAPQVEQLLTGRTVIAYNAPFDQGRLHAEQQSLGRATPGRWWCLMRARAAITNRPWQALHGGHRAAGDCRAALAVLHDLALTHQP